MSAKEIVEKMRDMDRQIIDGNKSNIFRETANLIESQILAVRELLAVWDRNYGRIRESMGNDNPRLQAVEEKIERLRAL